MSNIDELEKLAELKNKGILTAEEFEQKKNAILDHSLAQQDFGTSPKSRTTYGLLGFFLGLFGVHNFYLGRKIQGTFQLLPVILIVLGLITHSRIIFVVTGFYMIAYAFAAPFWISLNLFLTNKDGQGRLMKREGKTLCNVLGAVLLVMCLFVIPTCSIGGLAGYTMAMNRYRTSTILDYVSRCVVIAQTESQTGELDKTPQNCTTILSEPVPEFLDGTITVQGGNNYEVIAKITHVSQSVGGVLNERFEGGSIGGVRCDYSRLSETVTCSFGGLY